MTKLPSGRKGVFIDVDENAQQIQLQRHAPPQAAPRVEGAGPNGVRAHHLVGEPPHPLTGHAVRHRAAGDDAAGQPVVGAGPERDARAIRVHVDQARFGQPRQADPAEAAGQRGRAADGNDQVRLVGVGGVVVVGIHPRAGRGRVDVMTSQPRRQAAQLHLVLAAHGHQLEVEGQPGVPHSVTVMAPSYLARRLPALMTWGCVGSGQQVVAQRGGHVLPDAEGSAAAAGG